MSLILILKNPEAEEVAVSNYDSKDFYEGSLIGLNGEDNDDCHKEEGCNDNYH